MGKSEKMYRVGHGLHWYQTAYNNAYADNGYSAEGKAITHGMVQPDNIRNTSLALPDHASFSA